MVTLFYDCYQVLTSVYSGGAFIKQALNQTPIDEKNRASITKICYGVIEKDITLAERRIRAEADPMHCLEYLIVSNIMEGKPLK